MSADAIEKRKKDEMFISSLRENVLSNHIRCRPFFLAECQIPTAKYSQTGMSWENILSSLKTAAEGLKTVQNDSDTPSKAPVKGRTGQIEKTKLKGNKIRQRQTNTPQNNSPIRTSCIPTDTVMETTRLVSLAICEVEQLLTTTGHRKQIRNLIELSDLDGLLAPQDDNALKTTATNKTDTEQNAKTVDTRDPSPSSSTTPALATVNKPTSSNTTTTKPGLKNTAGPERARGRGRPQGSTNARNSALHNNSKIANKSNHSNISTNASNNLNAPGALTAESSSSDASDKLLTIGAKYGYPAPPPLSTYNGKIGRSFYTSPYNASTPILPNSQVAYSSGGFNNGGEWILCRVLRIISETRFEIQDPEPDELHPNGQIFKATYKEVILVPLHLRSSSISKLKEYKSGTRVLAKYPETTTFYPAEVVESKNGTCMLRFEGEEEVNKLTPVDRVFVLPCMK